MSLLRFLSRHCPGPASLLSAGASAAALLCAVSCANSSHLFIYQHSNFGFNAGTSPQSGNIHVGIGLRRDFACVIPKVDVGTDGDPQVRGASSYVASRVRTRSPFEVPDIAEVIATGHAAEQMGAKTDALSPFVTPTKETVPATEQ